VSSQTNSSNECSADEYSGTGGVSLPFAMFVFLSAFYAIQMSLVSVKILLSTHACHNLLAVKSLSLSKFSYYCLYSHAENGMQS
jgi:hypothetical protein